MYSWHSPSTLFPHPFYCHTRRDSFLHEATVVRFNFEKHRNEKDAGLVKELIQTAQTRLDGMNHPTPLLNIHDRDGTSYQRNALCNPAYLDRPVETEQIVEGVGWSMKDFYNLHYKLFDRYYNEDFEEELAQKRQFEEDRAELKPLYKSKWTDLTDNDIYMPAEWSEGEWEKRKQEYAQNLQDMKHNLPAHQ